MVDDGTCYLYGFWKHIYICVAILIRRGPSLPVPAFDAGSVCLSCMARRLCRAGGHPRSPQAERGHERDMHGDAVTDTVTAHTGIRSPAPRRSSALAAHTHSLATACPGRCSPPPREHGQGHAFFLVNHLDTDTALHSAAPNQGDAVAGTCGRRGLAAPGPTHAHRTSTAWPP
jgi:hypothetical protein